MTAGALLQAEIASQPACWRRALAALDRWAEALPRPGERVAAVGCGTSWFVAQAYAVLREQAVVQTRFATTTLALLRAHLGQDLTGPLADAGEALAADLPAGALRRTQFTFLGRGWSVGLANEAALKLREAALAWAEAYPAMEYRHGPVSVSGDHSVVWFLGEPPPDLAGEAAETGALVVAERRDPMAELLRVQRLAVAVALATGLDPDHPRRLARSVVLRSATASAPPAR